MGSSPSESSDSRGNDLFRGDMGGIHMERHRMGKPPEGAGYSPGSAVGAYRHSDRMVGDKEYRRALKNKDFPKWTISA